MARLEARADLGYAPPFAAGGGFGFGVAPRKGKKQPKPETVALDGLSQKYSSRKTF